MSSATALNPHAIKVIGHKNPDADSICAAIAYANLKNQLDKEHTYEPCRAGLINRETQFILDHFGVAAPALTPDVSPQLQDVDYRHTEGVNGEMSLRRAWITMRDRKVDTLSILDDQRRLLGLVTIRDMTIANMDMIDDQILAKANTSYANVLDTLDATVIAGNIENRRVEGRIVIGAGSSEVIEQAISKGDLAIVSNRTDSQLAALEGEAGCMIVCGGAKVTNTICRLAEEKGCIILSTPLSTYVAGQMIIQAAPIRYYMVSERLITFTPSALVESVTKAMATYRYRYFPVLDSEGRYLGLVSRRNLLNLQKKQLILVDHNERDQAVDGLSEAEVLEIIDHHRVGTLETDGPVYFRNVPVGCTCTIVAQMYDEAGIVPDQTTAGLMMSAILSDTLLFRSPTCTHQDIRTAEKLAKLAQVDLEPYALSMFESGEDVSGKTGDELLRTDYKIFTSGELRMAVGQGSFMTEVNRLAGEALVLPILENALRQDGLDYVFYMLTDIPSATTRLLMAGRGADELVRRAFQAEIQNGAALLPGVVSRKKQVIPALLGAIKQLSLDPEF